MNTTIFQFFHWYFPVDKNLWNHAKDEAPHLAELGVTHMWLPPAYKSAKGTDEPGYAVYDLYDLGEFDQKGSVRTRYGTKEEYLQCINAIHEKKMAVLADIVLNHKTGADELEKIPVHLVNKENRNEKVSEEKTVEAHTRFTFPGRQQQYSNYIWDWRSFSGVGENGEIHLILNEHTNGTWENVPEHQYGNYDFLLGCDIEFRNAAVRQELKNWGKWYFETTGIDGFRLDAVKHITADFYPEWLSFLKQECNRDFFCMGEYWKNELAPLLSYIDATNGAIQLFDVPLHFNFHRASKQGAAFDLRQIFDNTLIAAKPELAISFVDNHDTQPLQSLESWVEEWFKPHAYALILLRLQGTPCVFYTALYGAEYSDGKEGQEHKIVIMPTDALATLMRVRAAYAYGEQYDYFDTANIVGWTRTGSDEMPNSGCAVLITNADAGEKTMSLGEKHAGRSVFNILGDQNYELLLNEKGEGLFTVEAGNISVWVLKEADKK